LFRFQFPVFFVGESEMKRFFLAVLAIALLVSPVTASEQPSVVPAFLQGISVTVKAGQAQGSGTVVTRIDPDTQERLTFVWTAAHVVDGLRNVRKVVESDGKTKILVEFKDPRIVAERYQDGRRVGEQTLDCKVIKYSDADYGEDLALLMIRLRNSYDTDACAKFPEDSKYLPPVGADLSHCGSLLGKFGSNSYTTGVLSQTGRLLDGRGANSKVFDQVTAVAFPGSSGGGVYLASDGMYIGMLTQGVRMQGFNFIVPARRMRTWAAGAGVEWAINTNMPCPSLKEIEAIPVEDIGTVPFGLPMGDRGFTFNSEPVTNWLLGEPLSDCPTMKPFYGDETFGDGYTERVLGGIWRSLIQNEK
jgi:hypothetical protein